MKGFTILFPALLCSWILLYPISIEAVETATGISDREMIESLVRLEEGIKTNGKTIHTNREMIGSLGIKVGALETDIGSLKTEVSSLRTEVGFLRTEMASVRAEMGYLRTEMYSSIKALRDEILGFLKWGFGLMFTGMFILVGFILWDRRSTLKPVKDEIDDLRERKVDRVIEALKKMSEEDSRFATVLRNVGLL